MLEYLEERLTMLRLYYSVEQDHIQCAVQSAIIKEYEYMIEFLKENTCNGIPNR